MPQAQASQTIQFALVNTSQIKPNPGQPRRTFSEKDLEELQESIKERGITQPILVRRIGGEKGTDQFVIIDGERRWRACLALGKKQIPICLRFPTDEREAFELSLVSNEFHIPLDYLDRARAFKKLQETYGYTQGQISKLVGQSQAQVGRILYLLTLPQEIQEMVVKDGLPFTFALGLKRFPQEDREKIKVAADVMAGKITADRANQILEKRARETKPDPNDDDEIQTRDISWPRKRRAVIREIRDFTNLLRSIAHLDAKQLKLFFDAADLTSEDRRNLASDFDFLNQMLDRFKKALG